MRAWAYFNAARIYGEVPFIHPSLQSMDEIDDYINTGKTVIATEKIIFDLTGYYNDTLRNVPVSYDRIYLDLDAIIDSFSVVLEQNVKGDFRMEVVGIQYNIDESLLHLVFIDPDIRHVFCKVLFYFNIIKCRLFFC